MNQTELIYDFLKHDDCLMIVLDACRFDFFQSECEFSGDLYKAWSCATWTGDWIESVFPVGTWWDLTYVTATPHIGGWAFSPKWRGIDIFREVVPVYKWGWYSFDGKQSCAPWEVVFAAFGVRGRVIAHFLQPHMPHIANCKNIAEIPWQHEDDETVALRRAKGLRQPEDRSSQFSPDYDFHGEYRANLKLVLKELKPLLGSKQHVVITSDHGELLGEDGYIGHPQSRKGEDIKDHPKLRDVPWFVAR